jgi:hypothetical protein
MSLLYQFGFLIILQLNCLKGWSVFACKGQTWNITSNDNVRSMQIFQDWIYAWQNGCEFRAVELGHPKLLNFGGLGFALQYELKQLIWYVEMNKIYRADGIWQWAEYEESKNCTLGLGSIDCYFKPISMCGLDRFLSMEMLLILDIKNHQILILQKLFSFHLQEVTSVG